MLLKNTLLLDKQKNKSTENKNICKESYSVVETVTANGHLFPPLIIIYMLHIICYTSWCMNGPKDTAAYLSSDNNWQDKNTLFVYFKKFVDWSKDLPKPILVLSDGHVSHIQYRVSQLALENNTHIVTHSEHSSDKLQPLDVGVFGSVKKDRVKIKREYGRKTSFKTISKEEFPSLMAKLRPAFNEQNVMAGFKSSGIWPSDLKKALSKLPPDQAEAATDISASFKDFEEVDLPALESTAQKLAHQVMKLLNL